MKNNNIIMFAVLTLSTAILVSGFTINNQSKNVELKQEKEKQFVNFFVTHGHCSTPFRGTVEELKIDYMKRTDAGNVLEGMKLSFKIDPNTFNVCGGEDLTKRIKSPGLFINELNDLITFRTSKVHTMGIDWYQINGILSIKGVERAVKFFATGIRGSKGSKTSALVLEGQFNLMDWGIDYDKIVNGRSDIVPTKWMHLNMKLKI